MKLLVRWKCFLIERKLGSYLLNVIVWEFWLHTKWKSTYIGLVLSLIISIRHLIRKNILYISKHFFPILMRNIVMVKRWVWGTLQLVWGDGYKYIWFGIFSKFWTTRTKPLNPNAQRFYNMLAIAQQPLYEGSSNHNIISFIGRLLNIKSNPNASK